MKFNKEYCNTDFFLKFEPNGFTFIGGKKSKFPLLNRQNQHSFRAKLLFGDDDRIYRFVSIDQWMMANKAAQFGDLNSLKGILKSNSSNKSKQIGRTIKGYNQARWHRQHYHILLKGLESMVSQNIAVKNELLQTEDKPLIATFGDDLFFGTGFPEGHPDNESVLKWTGINSYGYSLMQIRDSLKQVSEDTK